MRNIVAIIALAVAIGGCAMLKSPGGIVRSAEIATTVANLDPLFNQTVDTVSGSWTEFDAEERKVLERSYRKLLSVRDTVESHIEKDMLAEIIIDLSEADLIYAELKDAYVSARDVVFLRIDNFPHYDQAQLIRLDARMRNLDYAISELRKEGQTTDITSEIKDILMRTAEIIQLYRMAKDPLGLTYGDRPEQTPL